jgi:hypothetical protein
MRTREPWLNDPLFELTKPPLPKARSIVPNSLEQNTGSATAAPVTNAAAPVQAAQPWLNDPILPASRASNARSEAPQAAKEADSPSFDGQPFSDRQFDAFAEAVAEIESGGNYEAVGGYNNHYQGKYQMGRLALADAGIGFSKAEREAFLNDPDQQEQAFQTFTLGNHRTLMQFSAAYRDMSSSDKLAVLGYAHNQGTGGALEYLKTGKAQADGFGTTAMTYVDAVRIALRGQG